jgi:Periplasmic binding protein
VLDNGLFEDSREGPTMIYTNVSFVGSTALADELMLLGPQYLNGVIVTQVVPAVDSYASTILKYKTALAKYFPGVPPDYVSLEGYVAGSVLLEGLKRAGPQLDTEKLVEGLETVRDFDMGLGAPISFGPTEHQGSLGKASGTFNTLRFLSGVSGIAIAVAVFAGSGSFSSPQALQRSRRQPARRAAALAQVRAST